MIKTLSAVLAFLAIVPALAAEPIAQPVPQDKQVTIIHWDQLKEGKLDGNAKDLELNPIIGSKWQTSYVELVNDSLTGRTVIVRFLGLTEPDYDLYIDLKADGTKKLLAQPPTTFDRPDVPSLSNYLSGSISKNDLEAGIPVTFVGTGVPADYRDYFSRVKDRAERAQKNYLMVTNNDIDTCKNVLNAVLDSIKECEDADFRMRTASIILAPKGRSIDPAQGGILPGPPDFAAIVTGVGERVQTLRSEAFSLIKRSADEADIMKAITPVDLDLVETTVQNKSSITARFTNWTDVPTAGQIVLTLPKECRARPITKTVSIAAFAKAEVKFVVTIPKGAKMAGKPIAVADLQFGNVPLKLEATAK